ncbi:uncharacterized protein DUF4867 [Halanaerobium saccharolyticum]|uniref:Uncharacterized protein DUF4867 n=1 Tax=Halanaerobium saccharolyticum TaxID=43595 RepID=A0A4R6S7S2_9FIRM|nr:DUF4867 family protein [Halanaerobium saccharolyticum]TDP95317.1 uncharacterized protein DUF4867 [Halanaerobium saccharolyticum]
MSSQNNLERLKKLNPDLEIKSIEAGSFKKYGRIIKDQRLKKIEKHLSSETEIPESGNVYQADLDFFSDSELKKEIEKDYYGEMPVEIGYCNGKNSHLNGLEYHNGSEINIAVTDLILLLGEKKDIAEDGYNSENIETFYLKKGDIIELYGSSLHFAPCRADKKGFKCAVILLNETNFDLEFEDHNDPYLFAKNKWLLVHSEKTDLINKGAKSAINGKNIEVKI